MRKTGTAAVVLAVVTLCSAAQSRELSGSLSISPFGGVVIPIGDFADNDVDNPKAGAATTGFTAGGAVEYGLTENVAIGGRFSYNQLGLDESVFEVEPGMTADGKYTVIEIFGAYVKLLMAAGKPTRPYIRACVMAAKPKLTVDVTSGAESGEITAEVANSLGLDGGVGVAHMFSEQVGGFIEGSFTHLMTDGKDVENAVDGVVVGTSEAEGNTQWVTIRGGITIFFGGSSAAATR